MIRHSATVLGALILSGCAFHNQVQRFGVEYNEALASMANEQTLLNILRASRGMPTHFTSVSRFTGTLSLKANGNVNSQLKGAGITRVDTIGNNLSTATNTGATNGIVTTSGTSGSVMNTLAEGVDMYTPQIGGEIDSGTTFDVDVYDQQKFYQGILSAVPFSTVEMLINQGFEPDLISNLLIARVDFYIEDPKVRGKKTGEAVATYRNDASDRERFQRLVDCNELDVSEVHAPETKIAPISRLEIGAAVGKNKLTLDQLSLLDGEKFSLSSPDGISASGSTDASTYVVKPGATSRIPRLVGRACPAADPAKFSPQGVYYNDGTAYVGTFQNGVAKASPKPVIMEIVFRSPEAVVRAVGEMVRIQAARDFIWPRSCAEGDEKCVEPTWPEPRLAICGTGGTDCKFDQKHYEPMFEMEPRRDRTALLSARFGNSDYSVMSFRSMQIISIIQQLINLQKESSESAISIPVRAVP